VLLKAVEEDPQDTTVTSRGRKKLRTNFTQEQAKTSGSASVKTGKGKKAKTAIAPTPVIASVSGRPFEKGVKSIWYKGLHSQKGGVN